MNHLSGLFIPWECLVHFEHRLPYYTDSIYSPPPHPPPPPTSPTSTPTSPLQLSISLRATVQGPGPLTKEKAICPSAQALYQRLLLDPPPLFFGDSFVTPETGCANKEGWKWDARRRRQGMVPRDVCPRSFSAWPRLSLSSSLQRLPLPLPHPKTGPRARVLPQLRTFQGKNPSPCFLGINSL